jgi:hypothetical protein
VKVIHLDTFPRHYKSGQVRNSKYFHLGLGNLGLERHSCNRSRRQHRNNWHHKSSHLEQCQEMATNHMDLAMAMAMVK